MAVRIRTILLSSFLSSYVFAQEPQCVCTCQDVAGGIFTTTTPLPSPTPSETPSDTPSETPVLITTIDESGNPTTITPSPTTTPTEKTSFLTTVDESGNPTTIPTILPIIPVPTPDPTPDPEDPEPEGPEDPEPQDPEDPEPEDPQNPDPENLDPENADPENPDPENSDPEDPDPENPDPENPDPENPDPENPDPENLDPENPDPENPDPENPDPENPDPEDPESPDPEDPTPVPPITPVITPTPTPNPEAPEPTDPEAPENPEEECTATPVTAQTVSCAATTDAQGSTSCVTTSTVVTTCSGTNVATTTTGPACSLTPAPGPDEALEPYEFDVDVQDYPTYSFNDEVRSSILGSLSGNTTTAQSTVPFETPIVVDPTPTPEPEPEPTEPDWESDACKSCSTNLGASECSADDDQCLIDQCKADSDCSSCGANCDTDFTSGEEEPEPEPQPEPEPELEPEPTSPDWNSDVCRTCQDKIGLEGDCGLIGEDDQCITDLCKSIDECGSCGANCNEDFKVGGAGIPADAPPDPSDPSCDVCLDDMNNAGCDDLFEFDPEGCTIDACLSSEACQTCGGSCDITFVEKLRR